MSAAWLDYDRDGLVDLFVGNYVDWSSETDTGCGRPPGYCGPDAYRPVAPTLYRNTGGGRFENVTAPAGLDDPTDKAMGVAVLDYDADGWPDLFVGSDRVPAKLYRNDGAGRFADQGLRAGVALSERGRARANMGVDAADYDRSGRPDILVGNFLHEMLGLYRATEDGFFTDAAPRTTVGRASYQSITWGVFFLDVDLDGHLDIFAANGGTDESQGMLDSRARLAQPPLLLRNRGDGTFDDASRAAGGAFARPAMGRGAAYADFDGDGDLDIVLTALNGPARLLRNEGGNRNNWLRVRLTGVDSNRRGIGAVVRVTSASGSQRRMVRSGSSYASQSELPLTFGLGPDAVAEAVEVAWPSGATQRFADIAANQRVAANRRVVSGPCPSLSFADTGDDGRSPERPEGLRRLTIVRSRLLGAALAVPAATITGTVLAFGRSSDFPGRSTHSRPWASRRRSQDRMPRPGAPSSRTARRLAIRGQRRLEWRPPHAARVA